MSHELYHSRISSGQILLHQNPSKSDRSINVLVVDDQNFNIAAIKAQLESLGVASDEAISGQTAVNLIKQRLNEMQFGN